MFVPLIYIPLNLRLIIEKYAAFRQNLYNKITIKLLEIKGINPIIQHWHKFLFAFRIYSIKIGNSIENYISLNMVFLIASIIMSRLHLAGYFIIFCLLFFRLDFSVLYLARFYKTYPKLLDELYSIQKRHMWSSATKVVQEAASNPQVQAITVGVMGALAWKALDVHDVHIQKEISEQEFQTQKEIAERELQAQKEMAERQLQAENQRHIEEMAMRKRELESPK